ncbi:hypothetical protein GLOIN_2v1870575 [Rhizophagus irregularis DAOM 181602=DAOM 197198]|nr:hypothetical protein GLOIN_2v1870575 [Rhizophagus irregularis DAOM 181602=DAOM 197198]
MAQGTPLQLAHTKLNSEVNRSMVNSEIVLEGLIIIILHHLSHGVHRVLFAMENMGTMDYMANGIGMEQNIVLPATLQAINSSSR